MNANYEYKTSPVSIQRGTARLTTIPHLHNEIELVYVVKGSTVAYADRNVCEVSRGELYISFPNQIHYYASAEDSLFYVLIVTPRLFYGKKELLSSNIPQNNSIKLDREIDGYINTIVGLSKESDISEYTGYFNLLFSKLLKKLSLKPIATGEHSALQSILEFCSTHFSEDLSLDYVAENLHLSRYHISRLFSQKLELSFSDYVNMLRVRESCDLLRDPDKKIADISEEVGFGSIRTYNRAFKAIHKKTPAQYRESLASLPGWRTFI